MAIEIKQIEVDYEPAFAWRKRYFEEQTRLPRKMKKRLQKQWYDILAECIFFSMTNKKPPYAKL